jgi:predicted enzyme related to lactoylglutathione lyase
MHKSQLAGFIIDCKTDDLDAAADFWAAALGMKRTAADTPAAGDYVHMEKADPNGLDIEVQKVGHESRVHLDIETDDIEAEVARLEKLGAKKVKK